LFASVNSQGLFFGNPKQFLIQLVGILVTIIFAGVGTIIIAKVTDLLVGLRVEELEEIEGLDFSQHGESAITCKNNI